MAPPHFPLIKTSNPSINHPFSEDMFEVSNVYATEIAITFQKLKVKSWIKTFGILKVNDKGSIRPLFDVNLVLLLLT